MYAGIVGNGPRRSRVNPVFAAGVLRRARALSHDETVTTAPRWFQRVACVVVRLRFVVEDRSVL
ncbi:hypothetical protein [Ferrimicrobium sp.]|uniref:hypothetical protein n=1 Tax=Ferrimicrobium sp. TaxID=2926050 RepID=UPI002634F691|nr:hypothetical protein [Ferrimicrobium sp.]